MTLAPITVVPDTDGTPRIRWDMPLEVADTVMTVLARAARTDPALLAAAPVDPLYRAISQVADRLAHTTPGCPGLWPDAAPMSLSEPAVLGCDTGDLLAVLIPGAVAPVTAISTALAVADEAGAPLDLTDETLHAEVWQARWMRLNTCESPLHDFHPELAAHGPATPGAVLITRVDLLHRP